MPPSARRGAPAARPGAPVAEPLAAHQHRGTPAVQRMVEYAPSTGGLALWVHHRDLPAAQAGAPLAATDGHSVFYAPAFERLPLAEQTGQVAHLVLHVALRHAQRYLALRALVGDVDLRLFNTCADAVVNSTLGHLAWLSLPPQAVRLEQLLSATLGIEQPVEAALLDWDVERLYRAIDDRRPDPNGGRRAAASERAGGQTGQGADAPPRDSGQAAPAPRPDGPRAATVRALGAATAPDLQPGPDTLGAPEDEADQSRAWSERLLRGHAGDGAYSMLRTLLADVPALRTPWEQVLRTRLARGLAPRPELSWSRPSRSYLANQGRSGAGRRMPFEPGTGASRRVPRLVVVVDVSGSIDGELVARFAAELKGITRRLGAGMVLVIGDDQVRHVEQCRPGRSTLRGIHFDGGGGTDFTPLLEEADRHDPDLTVVLTDLDGPARFRPRAPVLWAVPDSAPRFEAPFGRRLGLR